MKGIEKDVLVEWIGKKNTGFVEGMEKSRVLEGVQEVR